MHDYISPDNKHSTLIIIDVQRDFTLPAATAEIPGTILAVPNIQQLAQKYRKLGYPIIHMIRLYHQDGSNVDLCRRELLSLESFSGAQYFGVLPQLYSQL